MAADLVFMPDGVILVRSANARGAVAKAGLSSFWAAAFGSSLECLFVLVQGPTCSQESVIRRIHRLSKYGRQGNIYISF